MSDEFVGRVMAFRGEDEIVDATNVLLEVTEVADGNVELAFNFPASGKPRIYVSFPVDAFVARAVRFHEPKK